MPVREGDRDFRVTAELRHLFTESQQPELGLA
jgi:hypothetical protein